MPETESERIVYVIIVNRMPSHADFYYQIGVREHNPPKYSLLQVCVNMRI